MTTPFFGPPIPGTAERKKGGQTDPFFGTPNPLAAPTAATPAVAPFFSPQTQTPQGAHQAALAGNPFFGAEPTNTQQPDATPNEPTTPQTPIPDIFPTANPQPTTQPIAPETVQQVPGTSDANRAAWRTYQTNLTNFNQQFGGHPYDQLTADDPRWADMPKAPTGIPLQDQVALIAPGQEDSYVTNADGSVSPTDAAQTAFAAQYGKGAQASRDFGDAARRSESDAMRANATRAAAPASWEQYGYGTDAQGNVSGHYRENATDPFTQFTQNAPAKDIPEDMAPGNSGGDQAFDYNTPGTYDSLGVRVDKQGQTFDTKTGKQLSGAEVDSRAKAKGIRVVTRRANTPTERAQGRRS